MVAIARKSRFLLNACPKCAGTLIRKEDVRGPYLDCIQCGMHIG